MALIHLYAQARLLLPPHCDHLIKDDPNVLHHLKLALWELNQAFNIILYVLGAGEPHEACQRVQHPHG